MSEPTTDPLSPYVTTLQERVRRTALEFLGLSEAGRIDIHEPPENQAGVAWWMLVTHPELQGVDLELFELAEWAEAWLTGERFGVAYVNLPGGVDPFTVPEHAERLNRVSQAVKAGGDTETPEGRALALGEALDDLSAWRGIDDRMFRQISVGPHGATAVLRLGFRCNQDCYFCWQDRQWPEPPSDTYLKWIDEMAEQGVTYVSISGGEPTLHKALLPVIERARGTHGMGISLQTNAIRFRKRDYLAQVKSAGLDSVFISFHSSDADTSDAMTRAPRTWSPTVEGIEACLSAGIDTRLNCVVEQANHAQLAEHARFIVERFVTPFPENPVSEVTYSFPSEYFDDGTFADNTVSLDAVRPQLLEAVAVLTAAGVPVQGMGTCGFPPCVLRDAPEVIWGIDPTRVDELDLSGREYGAPCEGCAMRPHCLGVRREYRARFGDAGLVPFESVPGGLAG